MTSASAFWDTTNGQIKYKPEGKLINVEEANLDAMSRFLLDLLRINALRVWWIKIVMNWWCSTYAVLDILFSSNHNIHKSSCGLCFWASDTLIDIFYLNLSIKGSEAQKQRPNELLWMLWFDEKSISSVQYTYTY